MVTENKTGTFLYQHSLFVLFHFWEPQKEQEMDGWNNGWVDLCPITMSAALSVYKEKKGFKTKVVLFLHVYCCEVKRKKAVFI